MFELSPNRNEVAPEVFIDAVVQNGGGLTAIHEQLPQLGVTFIGEYTPADEEVPDGVVPYSATFGKDAVKRGPGVTVRARGSFKVTRKGDGYQLGFRSGTRGDSFRLQDIDEATALAFEAYGPTYTEVDLQIDQATAPAAATAPIMHLCSG